MCLFPLPNTNFDSLAYRKGVHYFDCGACPECLQKRSSVWALRSVYECRSHVNNCMITLTYDNFSYDDHGQCIGELPVNPELHVCKDHVQKFIKRLRRWIEYNNVPGCDHNIKYLACAEYGSTTHRAHYHCILFGVDFPDRHFYKKSKRGNPIYMSSTLTRLWSFGICTIDSINIGAAVARYCTKYCAKSRSDDTFMLFSQGIGFDELVKDFNGLNYFIDGREYPVPRSVWQWYIMDKYRRYSSLISSKYVNHDKEYISSSLMPDLVYEKSRADRKRFRYLRDRDPLYVKYIDYWSSKTKIFNELNPPVLQRILALDDSKFHSYKVAALDCLSKRKRFIPFPAPGSNCISAYLRYDEKLHFEIDSIKLWFSNPGHTCRIPSCLNTASDTQIPDWINFAKKLPSKVLTFELIQCSIFDMEVL